MKHEEFHFKKRFEKLVHLVGFIVLKQIDLPHFLLLLHVREDLLHSIKFIPLMQQLEMPHNFQKSVGAVICEEKLLIKDRKGEKIKNFIK